MKTDEEKWITETFAAEMPTGAWDLLSTIFEMRLDHDEKAMCSFLNEVAPTLRRRDIPRDDGKPYMTRYAIHGWMPEDGEAKKYTRSIYLHHFQAPDYDEAPHNHPWVWARALVLAGGYLEQRVDTTSADYRYWLKSYRPGDLNRIDHDTFHVVKELYGETWTLFSAGPKTSTWGFWLPDRGLVPWRDRMRERGLQPEY